MWNYGVDEKKIVMRKKNETDQVNIRVHPAVKRYITNHFPDRCGAYDLRGHFLHDYLRAGLTKLPQNDEPLQLPEIRIAISRRDGQRLGTEIPAAFQAEFSRLAYKYIQQTACMMVLFAHTAGGVPRDTAIKEYLLDNLFEDDELNYAALRKYYQRNWMETERRIKEECNSLTTRIQHVRCINNFVKNVPFYR